MRLFKVLTLGLVTLIATATGGAQAEGKFDNLLGELGQASQLRGSVTQNEKQTPTSQTQIQLSFAPLVKQAAPSVVNVYAARRTRQVRSPFMDDPFFEHFFGQRRRARPRIQSSLGSGVIVDDSGIVVTNYHVIANADEVRVALADGREFDSKVLLKEERFDLAILKLEIDQTLPAINLADSDVVEVGDLVLAIGNPFGVGQTTTSGIVSALARNGVGVSDFGFFIQTDAAINPGNSGGALVDMQGRLIGVNTAIFSRSGGSNGIGFAIPSNMVRAVINQAMDGKERFELPWIGAEFSQVTADIAESLGLERPLGALVGDVIDDSPAKKAGLQPGDVVLELAGKRVEHPDAIGYRLAAHSAGSRIELKVFSRGELRTVPLTLAHTPADVQTNDVTIEGNNPFAGAVLSKLTPSVAEKLRIRYDRKAVFVRKVARGSIAARSGIAPGDVVMEINGTEITDIAAAEKALESQSRWWRFVLNRRGSIIQRTLRY